MVNAKGSKTPARSNPGPLEGIKHEINYLERCINIWGNKLPNRVEKEFIDTIEQINKLCRRLEKD